MLSAKDYISLAITVRESCIPGINSRWNEGFLIPDVQG